MNKYRDMLQDTWLISPVPYTYEHKYDEFWEKYNEEKHKTLLNCAREFGENAPWKELSKELRVEDLDFIREFREFIYWNEIDRNLKSDTFFYNEFRKEIESAFIEDLDFNSRLIDELLANID